MVNTYSLEVFLKTIHLKNDDFLQLENIECITIEVNFCELIQFNIHHDFKENKKNDINRYKKLNKIEINGTELQELKIGSGVSALFLNNQEDFNKRVEQNPAILTFYESSDPNRNMLIGSSKLLLDPNLAKILMQEKNSENLTPVHIEEILSMYDQNKKIVGLIMLSMQVVFLGLANTSQEYCEWAIISKISNPSISISKNKTNTQNSCSDTCCTSGCQNSSTCSTYSIDSCSSHSLSESSEDCNKKNKNLKALSKKRTEVTKTKCNICKKTNNNCQPKVKSDNKKKSNTTSKEIKSKVPTKQNKVTVSKTKDNTEKLEMRKFIYACKNSDVCQKCEGIILTKKIKGDKAKYADLIADMKYKCKTNKKSKSNTKSYVIENAKMKNIAKIYKG